MTAFASHVRILEDAMPGWFKAKTALVDALVAAGAAFSVASWFAAVLHVEGAVALYVAVFGLLQLFRFVNAQLASLEWAKMHEAILVEKKAEAPARADGYREAGVIDEPPAVDDEFLAREVPRRRRNARLSLGVAGALVWLVTLVPGFLFGAWAVVGIATALALAMALFVRTMNTMRKRDAHGTDYFMQHLERDTKAILERKRTRIESRPEEPAHLRVGVDFGVPSEELDGNDETEAQPRAEKQR